MSQNSLNCYTPRTSPFSQRGLKKSDAQLQDLFPRTKIGSVDANAALVNHEQIDRHQDLEDNLLQNCRVHTLLRLPPGIWY